MTAQNQQQNLINDLKAPIKSFRIFALEEVIRSGASSDMLVALNEAGKFEDDAECQMLINHAIAAVTARMGGSTKESGQLKIKEAEEFMAIWKTAEENDRMRILSDLPARLPKGLQPLGPVLMESENSSVISAKIIRVFCRTWPEEMFDRIVSSLNSQSLSLKLAALRTIVHMNPELLLNDLPVLLKSKDPQIKALAIRGLVKIDREEALKHLQGLLLSAESSDRLAAIQNCPFFPFEMVKPVLLKYFAAENNPDLLIRAGWILEMNPDVQVPFKLFEIAERSPAKKSQLVKAILNDAVKLLEKSGILGDQFAAFTAKLQAWVNKKNALRFTKQVAARLNNEIIEPELDQTIRNGLKQKILQEAFQEALSWPVSETVKSRLQAYLKSCAPTLGLQKPEDIGRVAESPVKIEQKSIEVAEIKKQGLLEQTQDFLFEFFAGLDLDSASKNLDEIKAVIGGKGTSSALKIAAFHAFTRLKARGLEALAIDNFKSSDTGIATATVEYLGEVDPESIFPFIGQCLKIPDVRMKSAALGILKNFDFNQAVSSLNAMLRSRDPEQQRMALECMDQFDFTLIRDQLTDFLCQCSNESLVETGLCHFAANPSPENAYSLYKIEKAHSGHVAAQIAKMREKCQQEDALEGRAEDSGAQPEEDLRTRYLEEQEKKKNKKPAYAYQEDALSERVTSAQQLAEIIEFLRQWANSRGPQLGVGIIILLAVVFYVFFMPGEADKTLSNLGGAVVSQQISVEGTVLEIDQLGAVILSSRASDKFILTPQNDGFRLPKPGAKLRISALPYRKTADNMYLVRLISLREIEEFSQEN